MLLLYTSEIYSTYFTVTVLLFYGVLLLLLVMTESGLRIRIHFIRIQHFRLNTNPDSDPIRIQGFNDQKLQKKFSWKKKNFWPKTAIYLSLGLHKVRPSYRRSLPLSKVKRGHPTLQNMNVKIFSTFVGNFCPPGSGSTDPIESGSATPWVGS